MSRERLDLPLKISLTNAGVEWFAKNHKMLKRLQMADNWLAYGIAVDTVPASSLRKMINVDYIASVELARSEFSSKSIEIIDLTKLIIHRILFKKFESESFRVLVSSALIMRWNQQNPGRRIDMDTQYNQSQIDTLFASAADEINAVSLDIQAPLLHTHLSNEALSDDDRRLRAHLSDGFTRGASRLLWCVLTKSRDQPEYGSLILQLRVMLEHYIEKALVSEYLALMVVELLEFAEFSHYQQLAWLLRGRKNAQMADEPMRTEVRRHMQAKGDTFSLTYRPGSRGASICADHRLRVTIQEQGYQIVKAQLEALMAIDAKEHSLPRFSRQRPGRHSYAKLGLHNFSFLQKECQKKDVGVEIFLSKIPRTDLTLLNLAFQL